MPRRRRRGDRDREALPLQVHIQRVHEGLFILDDQDAGRRDAAVVVPGVARTGGMAGREVYRGLVGRPCKVSCSGPFNLEALPLSGEPCGPAALSRGSKVSPWLAGEPQCKGRPFSFSDSTWTLPRWLAATCQTIARPRPVPPVERLRPAVRRGRSVRRSARDRGDGMPIPWSSTTTTTSSPSARPMQVTLLSGGENFTAFSSRLRQPRSVGGGPPARPRVGQALRA